MQMQKIKVRGHSFQKNRVETDGLGDEQTVRVDCITSLANAVGNKTVHCLSEHCCKILTDRDIT